MMSPCVENDSRFLAEGITWLMCDIGNVNWCDVRNDKFMWKNEFM